MKVLIKETDHKGCFNYWLPPNYADTRVIPRKSCLKIKELKQTNKKRQKKKKTKNNSENTAATTYHRGHNFTDLTTRFYKQTNSNNRNLWQQIQNLDLLQCIFNKIFFSKKNYKRGKESEEFDHY